MTDVAAKRDESGDDDLQVPVALLRARCASGGPMTSTQKPKRKAKAKSMSTGVTPQCSTSVVVDAEGKFVVQQ